MHYCTTNYVASLLCVYELIFRNVLIPLIKLNRDLFSVVAKFHNNFSSNKLNVQFFVYNAYLQQLRAFKVYYWTRTWKKFYPREIFLFMYYIVNQEKAQIIVSFMNWFQTRYCSENSPRCLIIKCWRREY